MPQVNITALKAGGKPASGAKLLLELISTDESTPGYVDGSYVVVYRRQLTTDRQGHIAVELEANENISPANTYYHLTFLGTSKYLEFQVPDGDGPYDVEDLLITPPVDLQTPHETDPLDAHNASAISVEPFLDVESENVQDALQEIYEETEPGAVAAHLADVLDAHNASAISFVPAGNVAATNVQVAVEELDDEKEPIGTAAALLAAHEAATILSFNGRIGDVLPEQADYDEWFLTPAEGNAAYVPLSAMGAAGGVATLDVNTKIPTSQLPSLAITSTFVVGSQAAMLALAAQEGDVAVRTDTVPQRSYILTTNDPTQLANWLELVAAGAVTSYNGRVGDITPIEADYDSFYPTLATFNDHSTRHENGGADEISIAGLDGISVELAAHLADATAAHAASAISFVPFGTVSATNVQDAIQEAFSESGVQSFNGRSGAVVPVATDYDTFYLAKGSLTNGSVLFASGGQVAQDNANLFWDNTNNRFGVGTVVPAAGVHFFGKTALLERSADALNAPEWQYKAFNSSWKQGVDVSASGVTRNVTANMTNGSAVLTLTSGALTFADKGKTVVVPGAGPASGSLTATITTVTDATHATLSVAASTSVVGATVSVTNLASADFVLAARVNNDLTTTDFVYVSNNGDANPMTLGIGKNQPGGMYRAWIAGPEDGAIATSMGVLKLQAGFNATGHPLVITDWGGTDRMWVDAATNNANSWSLKIRGDAGLATHPAVTVQNKADDVVQVQVMTDGALRWAEESTTRLFRLASGMPAFANNLGVLNFLGVGPGITGTPTDTIQVKQTGTNNASFRLSTASWGSFRILANGSTPGTVVLETTNATPMTLGANGGVGLRILTDESVIVGSTATALATGGLTVYGAASQKTAVFRANATTPGNVLELQDSAGTGVFLFTPTPANATFDINRTDTSSTGRVRFLTGASARWGFGHRNDSTTSLYLRDEAAGENRLTFVSLGPIQVGPTSAPVGSSAALRVGLQGLATTTDIKSTAQTGDLSFFFIDQLTVTSTPASTVIPDLSGLRIKAPIATGNASATRTQALLIETGADANHGVAIRQASGTQSGALIWFQDSAGSSLSVISGSGRFAGPDGSVSAPAFQFNFDSDNGLYRIGTNNWAASAGGSKIQEFKNNAGTLEWSVFGVATVARQTRGATLTNNVTAGGTDDTIDNIVAAPVDVNAASLTTTRNAIYQLTRALRQHDVALRAYGLLT